jgi:outer membrane protein OmpA-like peptidoglycan-associated protein/tetratricopeptide (TPR) repeat protein
MLKQIFTFLFFVIIACSFAQEKSIDVDDKKEGQLKSLGREAERTGQPYLALEYYKQVAILDTSDIKNQLHLATLYRYTRNYKEAEAYYQKVCNKNSNDYPDALFYLATMQKANGNHKNAIETLTKFKKIAKKAENQNLKRLAATELEGCNLAIAYKDSVVKIIITSLGKTVNNPHIDFSPIPLTEDKIIFGSLREKEEKFYKVEQKDSLKLPTRKFYVAEKNDDKWEFWGEWKGPFNSEDVDVGNGTFSIDRNKFYFTKCAPNWQYKIICKIYYSEKKGDNWGEPQLMDEEINVPDYTSSHPTIGRESKNNQEVIYFTSDRENGKGGLDIWYTEYDKRKKKFKTPKNAGAKINSVGTETTPYFDLKTKTLYYSTDGKPNIGGLDIYKSQGETNKWLPSVNLGTPINSYADDLDFALKPSAKGGYVVSNRAGGQTLYNATCCDDIYEFLYSNFIELVYFGEIIDKKTKECVTGDVNVNVYIVSDEDKYLSESVNLKDCDYLLKLRPGFKYLIEVNKDGYFNNSMEVSTLKAVKSDSVKRNIEIEKMPEKPLVIQKLTYDFNSAQLSQDSKNILDTTLVILLKKNPDIIIEVYSHTDNKGSDEYNMKLSQQRAESVVNYLTAKGFNKNRFKAVGYGETKPLVPNENPDKSDNPSNRQINRRTEFKITGKIDPNSIEYDFEESTEKENKKNSK